MNSPGIKLTQDILSQSNVIEGNFNQHKVEVHEIKAREIRAIAPMLPAGLVVPSLRERLSRKALIFVMFAHLSVFAALMRVAPTQPHIQTLIKPMLVSLVASPAPEPELAPLLPTPPKPEPVVKQQKPKPVVKEITPEPQPIAIEPAPAAPSSVLAPEPSAVAATGPEAPPKEVPVAEPKIEPPRFGAAYLDNPSPAYPAQSRRLGEEGRVLLRVLVSEDGNADTVQVETGSGSGRLDQAALEAVKKWRFIPAKRNNQPISAYVIVPIKFSLES